MHTVTSKDGSRIAYDRLGSGPTVILVGGALGYRRFNKMEELARLLAERCTVINYDRRGRGDSTEVKAPVLGRSAIGLRSSAEVKAPVLARSAIGLRSSAKVKAPVLARSAIGLRSSAKAPFALEREIEDIQALIEAAGGSASLWGWSSGGALALRAAGAGVGVERLSVYEVPFIVTPEAKRPTPDYGERLDELVAAGERSRAVKHFMRNAIGIPAPFVALMPLMPMWKGLKATAHTLPYDWAALGRHTMYGAPLNAEEWRSVTAPTLVVHGAKSPAVLQHGSRALAEVLPNAELRALEGVSHNVKMDALAPVLAEFFTRETDIAPAGRGRPAAA